MRVAVKLGTPDLMPSPPATDPDLVRGLRAGRRDAFERLYGEYHAPIYNLCARVLGDREEAKDVTQEVFIKAFDQLPAADAESFGLRPWLYRVATNACFNQLRSRRKLDGGGDAGLEQAASGVDEFERAQTVALVEQSLGEMNERYRTALVLKDLQGLPPEEIAEVMEVSRANADVLVHRARASFKTVFAKLAGSDAAAPAALGLVLLPLSVPAALQAMPPLPAHLAPVHAPPHPVISCGRRPRRRRAADQDRRRAHDQGGDRRRRRGRRHRRRRGRGEGGETGATRGPAAAAASDGSRRRRLAAFVDLHRHARRSLGRPRDADGRRTVTRPLTTPSRAAITRAITPAAAAMTPRPTTPASGGALRDDDARQRARAPAHTGDHSTSTTTTHDGGDTSGSHDGGSGD